jgi:hypothetical protein
LQREVLMIAFLIFFALITAFIVGCVCISMRLYMRNCTVYLPKHQFVTLSQEALIDERPGKQRRSQFDVEMVECAWRVVSISLGVVAVIIVLVVTFFTVTS